MKKIIGLAIAALLVLGIAGVGTFAFFSDTETSTGNTFTAGTLNLVATTNGTSSTPHIVVTAGGDGLNGNVVFSKIKPGDFGTMTWTFTNDGDMSGNLTMTATVAFNDNDGSQKNPETKAIVANGGVNLGLGDLVGARLRYATSTYVLGNATNYVPFSGLQAALLAQNQAIAGGISLVYTLEYAVSSDVKRAGVDATFGTGDDVDVNDNIIQGDSAAVDITFALTQS